MLATTVGQLLLNEALPEDIRDYDRVLDSAGIKKLFQQVADKHPEKYKDISKRLHDIAREAAYHTGGYSFGVKDFVENEKVTAIKNKIKEEVNKVIASPKLSDVDRRNAIIKAIYKEADNLRDTVYTEALKSKNPFAMQVISGARGNKINLSSLLGADLSYIDASNNVIPIPVLHSYGQGLSPAEYFGGSFGARQGLISTKFATQDSGYLCLAKGTLVKMADGSEKAIEQIVVGDVVLGSDKKANIFPVAVTAKFNNGHKLVCNYNFKSIDQDKDAISICATPDHKILTRIENEPEYVKMPLVSVGHNFRACVATPHSVESFIYLSHSLVGMVETFDIEVAHEDHLFVLANGLIVSNSKQLNQAAHRLMVSADDYDTPPKLARGIPVDTTDPDNEGALLAVDMAPYKRNTVLTSKVLSDLHNRGHEKILVRSPIVGGPADGGVFAKDVGIREKGRISPLGDMVGVAAAQALSEPLSQAQLGAKHSGGVTGASKMTTGFKLIDQLIQVPKHFPGGVTHAQVDGTVKSIEEAPAGGYFVMIDSHKHYIPTGNTVTVKRGDVIEAGDHLSDGIPNPAEIVKHKGVGEGRRYYVKLMQQSLKDSGVAAHRRNVELLARGLINHVTLTKEMGEYVPGDTIQYSTLEHSYQPREGHLKVDPRRAINHYLEEPVLHYSIGTKLKPSMIKELQRFNVNNVTVHKDPPPFEPEMVRGMENVSQDPDWMAQMLGSNLKRNLLGSVHRGAVSDELGTSFVPGMARQIDFGVTTKVRDYHKVPENVKKL